MKLTKTEARILEHLKTHRTFGASVISGRKPYTGGKVRPSGMREFDACVSLIVKGLAVLVRRGGENISARGWTTRVSEISIMLPKQGEVIAYRGEVWGDMPKPE